MGCTGLTMKSSQDSTFQFMVESRHQDLYAKHCETTTRWCPSSLAKLVPISPITMVYGTHITIVTGAYKPTNITGGPHIVCTNQVFWPYGDGSKPLSSYDFGYFDPNHKSHLFCCPKMNCSSSRFLFSGCWQPRHMALIGSFIMNNFIWRGGNKKTPGHGVLRWWVQYLCDVCWMFPCVLND